MVVNYNPDDEEWIALIIFMASAILAWISVAAFAHGFNWKSWWEYSHFKKPNTGMMHPMAFSVFFFLIQALAGVSAWLVWREGHRANNTPPNTESGSLPTTTEYFWANLVWIIYVFIGLFFGPCFFVVTLQYNNIACTALIALLMLLITVGLAIVGWLIWVVPGALFVVVGLFWLYVFIIACIYWRVEFDVRGVHSPHQALETKILYMERRLQTVEKNAGNSYNQINIAALGTMDLGPYGGAGDMRYRK